MELRALEKRIGRRLGAGDPVRPLLLRMVGEYRQLVEMLVARGTPAFCAHARTLYGASTDRYGTGPNLGELADELVRTLDRLAASQTPSPERTYGGDEAVALLQKRLNQVFRWGGERVHVCASDGIAAEAVIMTGST